MTPAQQRPECFSVRFDLIEDGERTMRVSVFALRTDSERLEWVDFAQPRVRVQCIRSPPL